MSQTKHSEVATLLQRIDAENQAATQALYGLAAGTARHEVITARLGNMHRASEQLIDAIGVDAALPLIIEVMNRES